MKVRVRDIMTEHLVTVPPDTNTEEAVSLMLRHGISGMPVVDEEGVLVGVVSEYDLLECVLDQPARIPPVARYMTTEVRTVAPEDDTMEVARIFLECNYRRLPVVEDGRLIGLVSRRDIIRLIDALRSLGEMETTGRRVGELAS